MVEAEAIHPDRAPALHQPAQIREGVGVTAVADDDAAQVNALLRKDRLLRVARAASGPGGGRKRHTGRLLRAYRGAEDVLDQRCYAGRVGGALDDGGLYTTRADALRDVADEEVRHRVDAVRTEVPRRHPPHPGGDEHLHRGPTRHGDEQVNIAAEVDGGQVDDRADAARVELGHLALGEG